MYAPSPEITADQVLQAFGHDAPSLFFGAAIVAVGLVAAAFTVIRRKFDPLLIYLALFAGLYGLRMWIRSDLLSFTMSGSLFYSRLSSALDFVVAVPAFLFLEAAGFLHSRLRNATYVLGVILSLLGLATLVIGPRSIFSELNAVLIIAALSTLVLISMRKSSLNRDAIVMRRGLFVFSALFSGRTSGICWEFPCPILSRSVLWRS
jgi:sigma-B regulation protein RsbU (phosphoserine phosphatase)